MNINFTFVCHLSCMDFARVWKFPLSQNFVCFQNGWGDCYSFEWLIPEIMGQFYSVVGSSSEGQDTGQAFSFPVELPVNTMNTEVEGNHLFQKIFLKNFSMIVCFNNSAFVGTCLFLRNKDALKAQCFRGFMIWSSTTFNFVWKHKQQGLENYHRHFFKKCNI